ncbi:hypothetical protein IID04_07505, partial [PVC group bacterium]|nr:hypothetical protein [PVC group bacterium]
ITGIVSNQGDADAFDVEVVFFDGHPDNGGTQIGSSINLASVLQGEAFQIDQNWTYPGGAHEIFMFLDPDDTIIESVEINNGASVLVPNPTAIMFIDDFEDANPAENLFGFGMGSNFLVFETDDPDLTGNRILEMRWANQDDWWASVVWDGITPFDASGFDFLSFRIKALNTGENVVVKLEDSQGIFPPGGIFKYRLDNISTTWEDINIPFGNFVNDSGVTAVNASELQAVVLLFDAPADGVEGTVHIDEVSFSEEPGVFSVDALYKFASGG